MATLRTRTVRDQALAAKAAWPALATSPTALRNRLLQDLAERLEASQDAILRANEEDLAKAEAEGLAPPLIDRLSLKKDRIRGMAEGARTVAGLPDPLGQTVRGWTRPNGLRIEQVRVPLGVVGFVYESRPNVTIESAALCLKAGNALVLRGGSSALASNRALVKVLHQSFGAVHLPPSLVTFIDSPDRAAVDEMLGLTGILDVVIPRGGEGLIRRTIEVAKVPVIETGVGNCHVFVDASADPGMARKIVLNAKTQRPGVCNAAETLLVHEAWAPHLAGLLGALCEAGVEIRGCSRTRELFPAAREASPDDWDTEYLDLILAVRVVDSVEGAISHVSRHGSGHSEAIVTNDVSNAEKFVAEVDAAAVYVNASTRFTDGGEFGFGAEVGISTQKLHARGPMGLAELTTTKYVVRGDGQIRS
ncbi:MAG: glutamate-5-semialdehyde dehydrogenase [Candidatus Sericytochromatia bacterium]|nr:glutamate-5-semialdehyde dehydrogenase [Candidatus Tanganyikabacteria bacterium]